MAVLADYIHSAMNAIRFQKLESGEWYAEIPQCIGVWASQPAKEKCRQELQEVLEDWLLLKLRDGDPIQIFSR